MLSAITPVQVEEVIILLDRLSEARQARAAQGSTQSAEDVIAATLIIPTSARSKPARNMSIPMIR